MMLYKQILVSGRVQGVFFRDSTRQKANELDLTGGVRNLRDGRVEVLVCGDEISLESLINWLKIGPKSAKVTTIEVVDLIVSDFEAVTGQLSAGYFYVWPTE
ncbi:MAG: acylphosphatase [Proteobacteria bacterium]|nr:acylphosphatase [Pseudomonadota bacterium]